MSKQETKRKIRFSFHAGCPLRKEVSGTWPKKRPQCTLPGLQGIRRKSAKRILLPQQKDLTGLEINRKQPHRTVSFLAKYFIPVNHSVHSLEIQCDTDITCGYSSGFLSALCCVKHQHWQSHPQHQAAFPKDSLSRSAQKSPHSLFPLGTQQLDDRGGFTTLLPGNRKFSAYGEGLRS